jgi:hypothetical protein
MPILPLILLAAVPVFSGNIMLPTGGETLSVPLRATMQTGQVTTYKVDIHAASLLPELAKELRAGAESLASSCHQDISAGAASFRAVNGSIAVAVPISFTQYLCTDIWGKKKIFSESGKVTSLIRMNVDGGRPRLVLESFSVDGLSQMAMTARTDLLLKAALERELNVINKSDELIAITKGLGDEGFFLTEARAEETTDGIGLTLSLSGPRGKEHFRRVLDRTVVAFR